MQYLFKFLVLFLLTVPALAQNVDIQLKPIAREIAARRINKAVFTEQLNLFKITPSSARKGSISSIVSEATVLDMDPKALRALTAKRSDNLKLSLPTAKGSLELELYQVNIHSEGFSVQTSDGLPFTYSAGMHYRGIIKGDNQSLVAISLFDNEVMGTIMNEEGSHVLGKVGTNDREYVYYKDSNLKDTEPPQCFASDEYIKDRSFASAKTNEGARTEATKCVRLYWEADYPIYTGKGSSTTNVINYLTGLFNQSKIIYDNDGISVTLAQIYVWTSASPYGSGTSSSRLTAFRNYRKTFNGDLAHLLSYGGGGGVAYVNALCATGYRYAYSGINSTYSNFPTYSWSVMVVTHEQGHVMGSPHTQSCTWNGNNTAIDNCVATEGGCPSLEGPAPAGGGTVMSYCHLTSTGTNMSKGFGPQPKQRIINAINAASCLGSTCTASGGGGGGGTTSPLSNNAVYRIVANQSGQLADVSGGSTADGGNVLQWPNNNGNNQRWRAIDLGGGYWKFLNVSSGKALQVANTTADGGNVYQWTSSTSTYQQWSLQLASTGIYYVINRGSGKALDVTPPATGNGNNIRQWALVNATNQRWRFELISASLEEATLEAGFSKTGLQIAPNPAVAELNVSFYAQENGSVDIELYDIRGVRVYRVQNASFSGLNEVTLALPASLKTGLYMLAVGKKRTKVLIQK